MPAWPVAKAQSIAIVSGPRHSPTMIRLGLSRSEMETLSKELKGYERVKNFIIALEDFTTDNGMLTPTLKLKRRAVLERYGSDLDALY
jgi:long-chain acyl-CoA synthetase